MLDIATILEIEDKLEYKFHAARYNKDDEPLNVFLQGREAWHNWNRWRRKKNEFNRKYIVSFIDFYPEQKMWLFGGIYEVLDRGEKEGYSYKIALTDKGRDLIGRLKISADITRGRAFKLENIYNKLSACEILREPYSGEVFSGYENISYDFSMLEVIFKSERAEWKTPLENAKGIYVIADKKTGKKYVGSAFGDGGIWSRWSEYMKTGTGGNTELLGLGKGKPLEYARKHFRITLLEHWTSKTNNEIITQRESYWKEALQTRGKHGYNKN